jgi:hypothetical protein
MIENILAELDSEISHLQQVRSMLTQNGAKNPAAKAVKRGRRKMSAEARKRIGDAQRKRWAKQRAAK